MKMTKQFLGVVFQNQEWQIVPALWLDATKKRCYWPTSGNVQELASTCTIPDTGTWSLWPVKEIRVSSGE